jgi:hypothetical protein
MNTADVSFKSVVYSPTYIIHLSCNKIIISSVGVSVEWGFGLDDWI